MGLQLWIPNNRGIVTVGTPNKHMGLKVQGFLLNTSKNIGIQNNHQSETIGIQNKHGNEQGFQNKDGSEIIGIPNDGFETKGRFNMGFKIIMRSEIYGFQLSM